MAILYTAVGAGTQETVVDRRSLQLLPGLEPHIVKLGLKLQLIGLRETLINRHRTVNGYACAGVGSVCNARCYITGLIGHLLVKTGVGIGIELAPLGDGLVPLGTLGRVFATLQVLKRGLIGSYQTGAAAHLDRQVGERKTGSDRHRPA